MNWEQIVPIALAVLGLATALLKHLGKAKLAKALEAVTDGVEQMNPNTIHRLIESESAELVVDHLKSVIERKAIANGSEKTLNKEVRKAEIRKVKDALTP